jgi:1-acyl-sn-glycerol-3-phosphate acyltransferase
VNLHPPRLLHCAYEYFALYVGLGLLGLICLTWTPFAMLLHPLLPRRSGGRVGRVAITLGFRIYINCLAALRACRFDFGELDALRGEPAMIIAPNHPCLLDAVLIISRLPVTCVMKAELMQNLFLGAGARLAGYIRNDSLRGMVSRAADSLRQGSHLLMFPEGTRSTRFPVNRFVGAIGLMARAAGVPVQTVFIDTDSPYLSKGWPLFRKPALPITYRIRLGRRFDAPKNVHAFVAELEAYYVGELTGTTPLIQEWLPPAASESVAPLHGDTVRATAQP